MTQNTITGIYFCFPPDNHTDSIDLEDIVRYATDHKEVKAVWKSPDYPLTEMQALGNEISQKNINRVIIAGFRSGFAKPALSKAMALAGKDPREILLAGFENYLFPNEQNTLYAKAVIACSLYNVPFETGLFTGKKPVRTETLVIGGGIAGIQASLEIANSHHKVYLVEKTGTIGGHMAMFDKTFPTLDCAACILTPKMVEVAQHQYIDLLTYSEIKDISGIPGDYKVRVLKKARRVNVNTCTGCGTCAEKCPGRAKSEFDAGTVMRKAIYIPFPQAVPNKYLIDADSCTYVQKGKCGNCVKVCPVENCINLDEKDELIEINVGNIILATGFKPFDAARAEQYGYGKFPGVITSVELERLVNASGPTGGNIHLRSQDKRGNWVFAAEGKIPKKIVFIHCIGSRDENFNAHCSRVCCMYSLKLAHLVKEKIPDAEIYEYYIDMRAYGKGYEEFYERVSKEIHVIRGKTAKVEKENDHLILRTEDIEQNRLIRQEADMVVLAVGLEPAADTESLCNMLGLSITSGGWIKEASDLSNSTDTPQKGISLAGTCQGPKDIPDTVVQASAAASQVIQSILRAEISQNIDAIKLQSIEKRAKELATINGT
ncbi:MAG: CoB--CoM heterodisulfide reductase iron-sulfur subunit A family protein [Bacteroidales bacterium]|jgi:heterodisulfide reductase subunit A